MIIGVGIDIVDIRRIDTLLQKFQDKFIKRIFTDLEARTCSQGGNQAHSFAKIFSLKEATIKAISDAKGIAWHDMEISHDENGKPIMTLFGNALKNLQKKTENFNIQISVSDEKNYATAYVLIESC